MKRKKGGPRILRNYEFSKKRVPMCGSLMTFIQINTQWYAINKPFKSYSWAPTYIENRAQFVEGAERNSI